MSHNIRKLEQLILNQGDNTIEYEGGCRGIGIFKDKGVSVQAAELDAGAVIGYHSHDTLEVLVVYQGSMIVEFEDGVTLGMGVGNYVRIPPACEHTVTSRDGVKVIGMLIPEGKGYPNV